MRRTFLTVPKIAAMLMFAAPAFAQEAGGVTSSTGAMAKLGAAIAIGVAAGLCGLGQGRTAAAACEGTARNPAASGKILVTSIVGLALIESLVIYALLIAFKLAA